MSIVVPNFCQTTLRAAITPSSTQLLLASGGSACFAIGSGNYVYLTIEDGNSVEICKFTNSGIIVNDTITVTRAQDGTTAKSFPAGACVKVAWNVQQVEDLVTQTFTDLFDSSIIPPNTMETEDSPPMAAPPANVIYAINLDQHQFWYWNGTFWTEIGNPADGVLSGPTDPSGAPDNNVAFYVNTSTGELFYWTGSVWQSIAGASGSTEEYWVRSAIGTLYTLNSESQVELGVIAMTNRYRTYPNGVAANTILQMQNHGGSDFTTLLDDAALEVVVSLTGNFGSNPVPEAVMNLVISNADNGEIFGNAFTIDPDFQPDITISATTGVLTWSSGNYFAGNLVYSEVGAGPWDPFIITQVRTEFHVVEAL